MKVLKRLVVKGKEYTAKDGTKKAEWLEIGRLMQRDDGTQTILLNTIYNLNALCKEGTDLWVSLFDLEQKKKETKEETKEKPFNSEEYPAEVREVAEMFNDKTDIPF